MTSPEPTWKIDEHVRIAALCQCEILDTEREQEFDDLLAVAKEVTGCPIILMSLVDETRQWFKSRIGLEAQETDISLSFCAHAIRTPHTFVVRDATLDSRFATNALVTGEPGIRFYAGAPLQLSDGVRVGTLCAIDRVPGELSESARVWLERLARHVSTNLDLRRARRHLRHLREVVMESALATVVTDSAGVVEWVNQAFSRETGYAAWESEGRGIVELLRGMSIDTSSVLALREALRMGQSFEGVFRQSRKDGSNFLSEVSIRPIFSDFAKLTGFVCVQQDLSGDAVASSMREAQSVALDSDDSGLSLERALEELAAAVENCDSSLMCVIFAHQDNEDLIVAGPSTPHLFREDLRNSPIDLANLSPAESIVEDIEVEPRWIGLHGIASSVGVRASWSMPILGVEGQTGGAIMLLFRSRRRPSLTHRRLAEAACVISALSIGRIRAKDSATDNTWQRLW